MKNTKKIAKYIITTYKNQERGKIKMIEAQWTVQGLFKADAQKVYEEIGDMATTPQEVLEKARNENTELHKCFEWNDAIAGEKYRIQQARTVLRSLKFIPHEKVEQPIRIFSYTPETNYKPTIQMVVNVDEYQNLLAQAKRELDAFRKKYNSLTELHELFELIDTL